MCDCWLDRQGRKLLVGDKVRVKLYPKGSGEGVLTESKFCCGNCGRPSPTAIIEGTRYGPLNKKSVLLLERR